MARCIPCDDRASIDDYCDRTLLLLLRTIIGVATFRLGPDALPRSALLFALALIVVWAVGIAESHFIAAAEPPNYPMALALLIIHISSFWLILQIAGFAPRFLQAVTASAACSALVSAVSLLLFLALVPALGLQTAQAIPTAFHFWLLFVDGYIVARSIEQHLFVGISVVTVIFLIQIAFYSAF